MFLGLFGQTSGTGLFGKPAAAPATTSSSGTSLLAQALAATTTSATSSVVFGQTTAPTTSAPSTAVTTATATTSAPSTGLFGTGTNNFALLSTCNYVAYSITYPRISRNHLVHLIHESLL